MGIKLFPCDIAFSKCIRERAEWKCQKCGTYYPEGAGRAGLHNSHYHGRGGWSTRLDKLNCISLCYGCHMHVGAHRKIYDDLMISIFGEDIIDKLHELNSNTTIGKHIKKNRKAAAKHFREQFQIMEKSRANGKIGLLDFDSFI